MKKISQKDVNINDTIELFHYCNDLKQSEQIKQWIELYGEDLKYKSIEFGQPLGIFLLLDYGELDFKQSDLLKLSTNFIKRAVEFDKEIKSNSDKYSFYSNELIIPYIELLKISPTDFNLLEKSFFNYLEGCLFYSSQNQYIGVYKRWITYGNY